MPAAKETDPVAAAGSRHRRRSAAGQGSQSTDSIKNHSSSLTYGGSEALQKELTKFERGSEQAIDPIDMPFEGTGGHDSEDEVEAHDLRALLATSGIVKRTI